MLKSTFAGMLAFRLPLIFLFWGVVVERLYVVDVLMTVSGCCPATAVEMIRGGGFDEILIESPSKVFVKNTKVKKIQIQKLLFVPPLRK